MHGQTYFSQTHELKLSGRVVIGRMYRLPKDSIKRGRILIRISSLLLLLRTPLRRKNLRGVWLSYPDGSRERIAPLDLENSIGFLSWLVRERLQGMLRNTCSKRLCKKNGRRNGSVYVIQRISQNRLSTRQIMWLFCVRANSGKRQGKKARFLYAKQGWIMNWQYIT